MNEEPLRRTALFDVHRALGARIVPFGGFEMPVQYAGILAEHDAVRKRAGLFDLSHMAQFELRGADVAAWADTLTVNHVATMKPFQARYNIFTNDAGGAHDDVIFYRLPDRWLLVVNAGNAHKMWDHLQAHCRGDVQLTDLRGERALIAVQGPRSVEVLAPLVDADIAALKYYTCAETKAGGVSALIARTGYTGEDGFEIFLPDESASGLWDALISENRALLAPCGLGARDVLRLEAGMPLYGHELTEEITPLQTIFHGQRRARRAGRSGRFSAHRGPRARWSRPGARGLPGTARRQRRGRGAQRFDRAVRWEQEYCDGAARAGQRNRWDAAGSRGARNRTPGDDGRITVL